jgi:hypothetical protein
MKTALYVTVLEEFEKIEKILMIDGQLLSIGGFKVNRNCFRESFQDLRLPVAESGFPGCQRKKGDQIFRRTLRIWFLHALLDPNSVTFEAP